MRTLLIWNLSGGIETRLEPDSAAPKYRRFHCIIDVYNRVLCTYTHAMWAHMQMHDQSVKDDINYKYGLQCCITRLSWNMDK